MSFCTTLSRLTFASALCFCLLIIPGCGSENSGGSSALSDSGDDVKPVVKPEGGAGGSKTPLVFASQKKATDIEGTWQFVFYRELQGKSGGMEGVDVNGGYITFKKTDDGYEATDLRPARILQGLNFEGAELTDSTVTIKFEMTPPAQEGESEDAEKAEPIPIRFDGQLNEDGTIGGSFYFPLTGIDLAMLKPVPDGKEVTAEDLEGFVIGRARGRGAAQEAFVSGSPYDDYIRLTPENRGLVAFFQSMGKAFNNSVNWSGVDKEKLDELAQVHIVNAGYWGDRAQMLARLQIARSLLSQGHEIELGEKYLAEAKEDLTDEQWEVWSKVIEQEREYGKRMLARREASKALREMRGGDADEASEKLATILKSYPTDAVVLMRVAEAAELKGDTEGAIDSYAKLLALPGLARELDSSDEANELGYKPPSGRLATLWVRSGKKRNDLQDHLQKVYEESVYDFVTDASVPATPEEGRTVLTELFTGQGCPPCVAADVATGALESIMPQSELIVLRYHLHIPAPDPMANKDADERSEYYGIRGTPSVFIDGKRPEFPVAGGYTQALEEFQNLKEAVSKAGEKPSGITLDVAASAAGEVVHISARAKADKDFPESARLRLVLVEREVDMQSMNGIRAQHMIVRGMPGGSGGAGGDGDTIIMELSQSMTGLKESLNAYLTEFEESISQGGNYFKFVQRNLELDDLALVAFVQDDDTQEILEATIVPIDGTIKWGDEEAETKEESKPEGPSLGLPQESKPAEEPAEEGSASE
ncbi:DUF1223 domain-containing protein [Calycomorphotria hydatis]|uniref:Thioredoxin domain-containing protein n=1 Tax=Calycomorphotria hydatis TaxID=2528027 RepID=A0A517TE04_9PLAN|nr:DUF1223 domain-containing protein [Calycomorphotria hydatis]QDT66592.1 hypothetical protein V22_38620 [Calycomorphotria hydatis]